MPWVWGQSREKSLCGQDYCHHFQLHGIGLFYSSGEHFWYLTQTGFLQYRNQPEEYFYEIDLGPPSSYILKTVICHCAVTSFLNAWL